VIDSSSLKTVPVVLVVEDEPLLRMLAVEAVEAAGFVAIEARDADEAVAVLESRSDISLLFTDIDMPGSMDGLKLSARPLATDQDPGCFGQGSAPRELPSSSRFVGKPYRTAAMVEELRSLAGPL
jgi:two-component system, response regulator PdtaR